MDVSILDLNTLLSANLRLAGFDVARTGVASV